MGWLSRLIIHDPTNERRISTSSEREKESEQIENLYIKTLVGKIALLFRHCFYIEIFKTQSRLEHQSIYALPPTSFKCVLLFIYLLSLTHAHVHIPSPTHFSFLLNLLNTCKVKHLNQQWHVKLLRKLVSVLI